MSCLLQLTLMRRGKLTTYGARTCSMRSNGKKLFKRTLKKVREFQIEKQVMIITCSTFIVVVLYWRQRARCTYMGVK